jgi:phage-related protein
MAGGFKVADAFVEVASRVAAGTNAKMNVAGREAGESFDRGFAATQDRGSALNKVGQGLRDIKEVWSSSVGPISDAGKAIAGTAIKAGALSTALVGATGLVGGVLSLVTSLSSVAGAAPVAGLALGQLKAVQGTLKIATLGVSDALSEAMGDSFKEVSPQAKLFTAAVKGITPALVDVKNSIQDAAFRGLSKEIEPLAAKYLPMLRDAGTDVARVFNTTVRNSLDFFKTGTAKAGVRTIIDGIRQSVTNLIPPLTRLPELLTKAGVQATPALNGITKQLGGVITTAINAFSGYLASGKLTGDVKAAFGVLSSLGHTVASVFGIVGGVMRAAHDAFGDVLSPIQAVTSKLSAYINSAGGQAKITQLFKEAKPVLAEIGGLFSEVLKAVGPLWPIVLKLADAFITGLKPVIPVLGELAGVIGNTLADLLPTISDLAVTLGKSLIQAMKTLAPVIKPVADALSSLLGPTGAFQAFLSAIAPVLPTLAGLLADIASTVGGALAQAFNDLAPVLPGLVDAFAKLTEDVVKALAPILPDLAKAFADLAPVIDALAKVADLFAIGLGRILGWLGPIAPAIIAVTVAVWALNAALSVNPFIAIGIALVVLVGLVVKYWDQITGAIGKALDWIKDAVAKAWDWVYQHTIGWLVNMGKAVAGGMSTMARYVGDGVTNVAKTIGGLASKAVSASVSFGTALVSRGADLIRGIGHGISVAWNDVISWLKGIPGRIIGAIGNLGSLLFDAGKRVISGFMDGIRSAWSASTGFFSKIAGDIVSLKGPPEKDSILLVDNGRRVMNGFIEGLKSKRGDLAAALSGITMEVPNMQPGAFAAPRGAGVGSFQGANGATMGGLHVGTMNVTIPAKDVAEFKSVTDFFGRVEQEARRQRPRGASI